MSIHVITGPMFCGKTSELIRRIKKNTIAEKKCFIIKYSKDNRYGKSKVCTHDNDSCEANIRTNDLLSLRKIIKGFDVIGIDEGQFFLDIDKFCTHIADSGKLVIVAGLDTNFKREPFGKMGQLMAIAEEVLKLTAICFFCKKDNAIYSMRISKEEEEIVIGGKDKYIATCRKCFRRKG